MLRPTPHNFSIEEILAIMPESPELQLLQAKIYPALEKLEELEDKVCKLEGEYEELDAKDDDKFDLLVLIKTKCQEKGGTRKELISSILTYIEESYIEV